MLFRSAACLVVELVWFDAELVVAAAVFALALAPMAWHLLRTGSPPAGVLVMLASLVAAAAVAMTSYRPEVIAEVEHTNRPTRVHEEGYASSQTCKQCHPGQYDSWHDSYHRTMTQVVSPDTVVAAFDRAVEGYRSAEHTSESSPL